MEYKPTSEERIWAALSHASAILFGMGLVIPIIAWVDQRKKSKYVAYHALQALGYQTIVYTVWFLVYLLLMILGILAWIPISINMNAGAVDPSSSTGIAGLVIILLLLFGSFLLYALLPVIAVITTAMGKDFRYPILGKRLAQYISYVPSAPQENNFLEENEEAWIAATGHFSVIIPTWGLLLPVVAFITQKGRSLFLRFQSAQTVVYQIIGLAGYLIGFVLYFVAILAIVPLAFLSQNANNNEGLTIAGFIFIIILMCCGGFIALIIPLYHILGQWAGLRVLKGDHYRYPLIGALTEKILKKFF
jgi:uncharacterized Tic20 family protein